MTEQEKLEEAKRLYTTANADQKYVLESLFPELKESKDERIRKRLITMCQHYIECYALDPYNVDDYKEALTWLEKQGDKPFDYENANIQQKDFAPKVEPKFKVGDWIANDYCMGKVIALTDDAYLLDTGQGIPFSCEHNVHLWTIADAKDGDVLCTYECDEPKIVFILKGMPKKGYALSYHCYYNIMYPSFKTDKERGCIATDDIKPATKEQRDLLFQKMKEAGYEWDAEKKELKKIEDEIEIPFGAKDSELQEVTYYIPKGFHAEIDDNKVVIKKGEQKPIDLNTVSIQKLVNVYRNTDEYDEDGNFKGKPVNCMIRAYEQGIRDILKIIKQKDVKPAWSEVDERNMNIIVSVVRGGTHLAYENVLDWFTALKYRVQPRLKQGWKPSDEQIELLEMLVEDNNQRYFYTTLNSLYQQLKKLREG